MGNFIYELSEGREVDTIEDFFEFLNRNTKKGTFATVYYTYPVKVNSTLGNKFKRSDEPNPYYGKLFKHQPIEFRWEDTYKNNMLRKDPNFEFKGGMSNYEPVKGVKIVQEGPNGRYFPVIPTGNMMYKPVYTFNWNVIPKEEIISQLPKPSGFAPDIMKLLMNRVAGISAGGAFWKNPEFEYKYMGHNEQKFS